MNEVTVKILVFAGMIFLIGLWSGFYVGVNSEMAKMKYKITEENE